MTEIKRAFLRGCARICGLIALLAGLGLCYLAARIAHAQLSFHGFMPPEPLTAAVVLACVGALCLAVGYRMLFDRPNKYGSLLSPLAWYGTGAMLAFSAIALASMLLRDQAYDELWAVTGPAFLSLLCVYSGKAAQSGIKNEKLAL